MCRKFDCMLYIERKSKIIPHRMALKAVLAFVLAVLGLHTYVIVHLSGKFGSWQLIMNITC